MSESLLQKAYLRPFVSQLMLLLLFYSVRNSNSLIRQGAHVERNQHSEIASNNADTSLRFLKHTDVSKMTDLFRHDVISSGTKKYQNSEIGANVLQIFAEEKAIDSKWQQQVNVNFSVSVNSSTVLNTVDDKFLSVTLDTSLLMRRWKHFNTSSRRVLVLTKALSPCYVRVGGTRAEQLVFVVNKTFDIVPFNDFNMTAANWDKLNLFVNQTGWTLIFDLNSLLRTNNDWNPTNALILMKYSHQKGYKLHLELGNEPDDYRSKFNVTISGSQRAQDFALLHRITTSEPGFEHSLLIGPDLANVKAKYSKQFFQEFLVEGSAYTNAITFHHYYFNGKTAQPERFTDPETLDSLIEVLKLATDMVTKYSAKKPPLWLGETSSAYASGTVNVSDTYIDGFTWLDKLGLSCVFGIQVVMRQAFFGGHYSLVDWSADSYFPNPDYWLTLLYKTLVGPRVLSVRLSTPSNRFRLYAACTSTLRPTYKAGAVTIYGLNMYSGNVSWTLPAYQNHTLHVYWLTPGQQGNLLSKFVSLNNQLLKLSDDDKFPAMDPIKLTTQPVIIPAMSFGFIVIPDANAIACR